MFNNPSYSSIFLFLLFHCSEPQDNNWNFKVSNCWGQCSSVDDRLCNIQQHLIFVLNKTWCASSARNTGASGDNDRWQMLLGGFKPVNFAVQNCSDKTASPLPTTSRLKCWQYFVIVILSPLLHSFWNDWMLFKNKQTNKLFWLILSVKIIKKKLVMEGKSPTCIRNMSDLLPAMWARYTLWSHVVWTALTGCLGPYTPGARPQAVGKGLHCPQSTWWRV